MIVIHALGHCGTVRAVRPSASGVTRLRTRLGSGRLHSPRTAPSDEPLRSLWCPARDNQTGNGGTSWHSGWFDTGSGGPRSE
jgi:hypothetical protein